MTSPDPLDDDSCTRCHAVVLWGHYGPPDDEENRICHECTWKELERLRAEREVVRVSLGKAELQLRRVTTAMYVNDGFVAGRRKP